MFYTLNSNDATRTQMIEFMPRIYFFYSSHTKAGNGDVFPALTSLADLEIFCHGI